MRRPAGIAGVAGTAPRRVRARSRRDRSERRRRGRSRRGPRDAPPRVIDEVRAELVDGYYRRVPSAVLAPRLGRRDPRRPRRSVHGYLTPQRVRGAPEPHRRELRGGRAHRRAGAERARRQGRPGGPGARGGDPRRRQDRLDRRPCASSACSFERSLELIKGRRGHDGRASRFDARARARSGSTSSATTSRSKPSARASSWRTARRSATCACSRSAAADGRGGRASRGAHDAGAAQTESCSTCAATRAGCSPRRSAPSPSSSPTGIVCIDRGGPPRAARLRGDGPYAARRRPARRPRRRRERERGGDRRGRAGRARPRDSSSASGRTARRPSSRSASSRTARR